MGKARKDNGALEEAEEQNRWAQTENNKQRDIAQYLRSVPRLGRVTLDREFPPIAQEVVAVIVFSFRPAALYFSSRGLKGLPTRTLPLHCSLFNVQYPLTLTADVTVEENVRLGITRPFFCHGELNRIPPHLFPSDWILRD